MISALLRHLPAYPGFSVLVVEVASPDAAHIVETLARQVCPIATCATRTTALGGRYAVSIAFPDSRPTAPRYLYEFLQVRCVAQCTKWGILGVLLDERGVRREVTA